MSREEIVRAAIEIADAEGGDAISMRRIAQALHAGAMSLYWHVANKEELIDLMIDGVFAELELPEAPTGDWRADLRLCASEHRRVLLRHPWVMPLLSQQSGDSPNSLRTVEFSLAALDGLPIPPQQKLGVFWSIHVYTEGFVLHEVMAAEMLRRENRTEGDWQAAMEPHIRQIAESGLYPHITSAWSGFPDFQVDEQFYFGLDSILDGIASRIDIEGR
jgi:AcrR family transcriptional regulator